MHQRSRLHRMNAKAKAAPKNSGAASTKTATSKPRGRPFKKGQTGNPNGRPPRRSMRKVFADVIDDNAREKIALGFLREAAKGSIQHYEIILREIGEAIDRQNPNDPALEPGLPAGGIFNLNLGDDAVRAIAQQFFVALAMGTPDARGTGELRQQPDMEALSAPDARK